MTEVKKEKLELQIKLEKANLEGTNQTVQDQIRIKQELIKSEIKREQLVLEETREEHPPPSPPAPKKQISKVRPQRPQKNAISLAKVAAIDTQDLFTYDNKLSGASPTKSQTSPSVKEMRSNQPDIETENQRYPTLTNIHRSKKRQNIDNLFDKYDSGIRIFNEDGSLETETEELRTEITKSPQDQELEFLFSAPKRLRSEKSKNSNEKVQIDEITNKYNFVENTDDTAVPFDDDVILNRSFSNEFSVRIKCRRHVYSYPIRQDSAFTEGDVWEFRLKKASLSLLSYVKRSCVSIAATFAREIAFFCGRCGLTLEICFLGAGGEGGGCSISCLFKDKLFSLTDFAFN